MKLFKCFSVLALASMSHAAIAGVCTIHVKRTACPGKEKESYAKCDGNAECDVKKKADDEAGCAAAAAAECPNSRIEITKSKEVTAKFGDKDLGKNFCEANRPDFNKCK